jgi:NADH-quinone oxidoreductase subunit L
MVMAVGLTSNEAAMFHLFTHAFFKALLFLGAGSILVSLHHEQDIWKMGGLAPKLKITFATFAAGALALVGCPPFSGFFSKDAILALAYQRNPPIFVIGLTTAFLTAFYVARAVAVVFLGKPRSEVARAGKESPLVMTIPLLILALFALIAGFGTVAKNFLVVPHEKENVFTVPALALIALILGVGIGVWLYRDRERDPLHVDLIRRRLYFDEFYEWLIDHTQELLARIAAFFDRWIIDAGAVRGASGGTFGIGALLRLFQVGNLQAYAFLFGLGIVALIYFTLFR